MIKEFLKNEKESFSMFGMLAASLYFNKIVIGSIILCIITLIKPLCGIKLILAIAGIDMSFSRFYSAKTHAAGLVILALASIYSIFDVLVIALFYTITNRKNIAADITSFIYSVKEALMKVKKIGKQQETKSNNIKGSETAVEITHALYSSKQVIKKGNCLLVKLVTNWKTVVDETSINVDSVDIFYLPYNKCKVNFHCELETLQMTFDTHILIDDIYNAFINVADFNDFDLVD